MNYELWMRNESGLMKILPRTVVLFDFNAGGAPPLKTPPDPLLPLPQKYLRGRGRKAGLTSGLRCPKNLRRAKLSLIF